MSPGHDELMTVDEATLAAGYERLYADDPDRALDRFKVAVAVRPDAAEAWGAMGDAADHTGERRAAATRFARAARLEARWTWRAAAAENLLAFDLARALDAFLTLREERPDSVAVRRGAARALFALGRAEEAATEWREAAALAPDDAEAALEAAEALIAADEAVAALEILARQTARGDARFPAMEARAWAALSETAKADACLARAGAIDPDHAALRVARSAVDRARVDTGLTTAHVRALFDGYAERFDHDLVDKLGYVAPSALRAAIDRRGGGRFARCLDLGCGTGLAGVAFRDRVDRLAGVDLSPKMVDVARRRGIYDELWVGDAVAAFADGRSWELIVAADVLVYIGDPSPLFAAAAAALVPGGLFAFTAERLAEEDGGPAFAAGPSRRFAHAPEATLSAALRAGFGRVAVEDCSPRREGGRPVAGSLYILER